MSVTIAQKKYGIRIYKQGRIIMIKRDELQKLLSKEGEFKENIVDNTANFHFLYEFGPQNLIQIIQPTGKNDLIVVAASTNVSPEHLSKINSLNNEKKLEFLWNFRLTLNSMGIDFQLQHPDNVLQSFAITDVIYDGAITKDHIMRTIRNVIKAKLQGIWLIQREFDSGISPKTNSREDLQGYV